MDRISPQDLRDMLRGEAEFALIDVREQGAFAESHLLFAACIPLSRIEILIADLVPRHDTCIVVVDDPAVETFADRAQQRLSALGYSDVLVLEGGIGAWQAAGFELFSGVNVPSKAFGEFVEHTYDTPRLTAAEVKAMLDEGRNMIIVDSRPFVEYERMSIPTGTDMPGAELAFRIHDVAPDPDTFVVVNCAGRTRSIIGAQSLINAGIPNPVAALKDGTMGWHLAGFELEHGANRQALLPSATGTDKGLAAAARVAERFGVRGASPETVQQWQLETNRTTYLLDVRSPEEFALGHIADYRNAPGGQLVQATDEYVAVHNARIVLADDNGVRATMTASWLIQMGWRNVFVLEGGVGAHPQIPGAGQPRILGELTAATISTEVLASAAEPVTVVDLGSSAAHERAHIPGAWWCVRARLSELFEQVPRAQDQRVVLTSPDGLLARLALADARTLTAADVQALDGGTERWISEGRPTDAGLTQVIGATDDAWYKPYEHRAAQEKFMRDYLTWEVALVEQIARDGTSRFRAF